MVRKVWVAVTPCGKIKSELATTNQRAHPQQIFWNGPKGIKCNHTQADNRTLPKAWLFPMNSIRRSLRSCRKSVWECPRKSDASQDEKYLFTIWKRRSVAFQPCKTLGGVYWVKMVQNNDFLPKNGLKTAFLSITILDHPTLDWAGTQNFKGIANFNMCFEK